MHKYFVDNVLEFFYVAALYKFTFTYLYTSKHAERLCVGSEWEYVILTTVRSMPCSDVDEMPSLHWQRQHLGFITDEHQINVALTRARKGLIIIGLFTRNFQLLSCPVWAVRPRPCVDSCPVWGPGLVWTRAPCGL